MRLVVEGPERRRGGSITLLEVKQLNVLALALKYLPTPYPLYPLHNQQIYKNIAFFCCLFIWLLRSSLIFRRNEELLTVVLFMSNAFNNRITKFKLYLFSKLKTAERRFAIGGTIRITTAVAKQFLMEEPGARKCLHVTRPSRC